METPHQLVKYVFKKGNKAAAGKHRKSMKQYAKEYLMGLPENERIKFLNGLHPEIVWRMAEGNPHNTEDLTSGGKPLTAIDVMRQFGMDKK